MLAIQLIKDGFVPATTLSTQNEKFRPEIQESTKTKDIEWYNIVGAKRSPLQNKKNCSPYIKPSANTQPATTIIIRAF